MQTELVNTAQMAAILGINRVTLTKLRKAGRIPALVASPSIVRYDPEKVIAALEKETTTAATAVK